MNRIIITKNEKNETIYTLITENGNEYPCYIWEEPGKTYKDGSKKYHVRWSKVAMEETGREYISLGKIGNSEIYEFETKLPEEHRVGLSHGGWRVKLTEEEKKELEQAESVIREAESVIEKLKRVASEREMTEEEKLLRELERLQAKLDKVRNQNN